jgi:anti-sigma-K factor RskA
MTHESYKEMLAAGALTALDAEDARALDVHLESCADCRMEIGEWEDTAALLALDAKPLEPSAQLRERILASVRAEGEAESSTRNRVAGFAGTVNSPGPSTRDSNVVPFERQRNVWTSFGSFGAIAAMLLLAVLIGSLVMLSQQNRVAQRKLAQLSIELGEAKARLDHERAVVELLTSPEAHMARLSGTSVAPGAHAMLAYDKTGHAMLMAKGLPAAPQGMAYQLWYIKDNKKMPGKVFTTDAAGNGSLEDQMPDVALGNAVFAITLEPNTGVSSPTGAIYLISAA